MFARNDHKHNMIIIFEKQNLKQKLQLVNIQLEKCTNKNGLNEISLELSHLEFPNLS